MGFETTIKALSLCIQAQVPVLLEGGVGEAKTAIVEGLARKLFADYQVSIVALHEPPEYGGYPVPQAATADKPAGVHMLPVGWVARLAKKGGEGKKTLLFLDEFSNGAPATRSATMRGVLDGTWGETNIPNLSVVVAMNPPEIAESGYELSAPLANRFCHCPWDLPVEYWVEQLIAGFPAPEAGVILPEGWRQENMVWARTLVATFANVRGSAMKAMPAEAALRSKPFPSLRSWTMAMNLLAACRACGIGLGDGKKAGVKPDDVLVKLIGGCVGPGAALEFITFASELDLPDPEELLKHPESLVLPERGDRAFAVLTAVVGAVLAKNTAARWTAAWVVLAKAVAQNRPDIGAGAARLLCQPGNRPDGTTLPKAVNAYVPMLKAAGLMT